MFTGADIGLTLLIKCYKYIYENEYKNRSFFAYKYTDLFLYRFHLIFVHVFSYKKNIQK